MDPIATPRTEERRYQKSPVRQVGNCRAKYFDWVDTIAFQHNTNTDRYGVILPREETLRATILPPLLPNEPARTTRLLKESC